jgi:hypothetical protein
MIALSARKARPPSGSRGNGGSGARHCARDDRVGNSHRLRTADEPSGLRSGCNQQRTGENEQG